MATSGASTGRGHGAAERSPQWRCSQNVKALLAMALASLVVCVPAQAKTRIAIRASDVAPTVGQRVTFDVRSERALGYDLRLIAVGPGQPVFRVVATITGDTSDPDPQVARHGFEIRLPRMGPSRWRGVARLMRPGRWRVVVPNVASVGVMIPNGAAMRTLAVREGQRCGPPARKLPALSMTARRFPASPFGTSSFWPLMPVIGRR